ncbi:PD-(D/E)XK nuclease family protein [Campylobacter magnus]|uniref:PD-(D/E)XK nuclease family protein n=1 Tax=Campylobacter magnus TaxID=3026462 RepID=A0ABT8T690_9BACT|nr:PD-(D/E)XK nuclease family protein [Campylobacter magnus]MDO2409204.1 PD-(D/E)XK nuclease family protein [Campylobacter magnus]
MIILNRVFGGGYLANNLGHEVINFFKADNGEHYIYVTPYGKVKYKENDKYTDIVLMRSMGQGYYEVLGWASDLECLISDEFRKKPINMKNPINELLKTEQNHQIDMIKNQNIKYNGILLHNLFSQQENSVYFTFKAGKFRKPKMKIYIKDNKLNENQDRFENTICVDFIVGQYLCNYLENEKEIEKLRKFLSNNNFWENGDEVKQATTELLEKCIEKTHLLEMLGKEYDELTYSNWISYVLNNDNALLDAFLLEYAKGFEMNAKETSVHREYSPKTKEKKINIGRIDLYISDGKSSIVIENKVKSGINGVKYIKEMDDEINQLDNYKKIKDIEGLKNINYYLLVPNHHDIVNNPKRVIDKGYEIITYEELYEFFKKHNSKLELYDDFKKALFFHSTSQQNRAYEIAIKRLKHIINTAE